MKLTAALQEELEAILKDHPGPEVAVAYRDFELVVRRRPAAPKDAAPEGERR